MRRERLHARLPSASKHMAVEELSSFSHIICWVFFIYINLCFTNLVLPRVVWHVQPSADVVVAAAPAQAHEPVQVGLALAEG